VPLGTAHTGIRKFLKVKLNMLNSIEIYFKKWGAFNATLSKPHIYLPYQKVNIKDTTLRIIINSAQAGNSIKGKIKYL